MFDWYAHDFSASAAPLEVAKGVAALMPPSSEVRGAMEALLFSRPKPTVRYAPYTWACHARLREWHWQPRRAPAPPVVSRQGSEQPQQQGGGRV